MVQVAVAVAGGMVYLFVLWSVAQTLMVPRGRRPLFSRGIHRFVGSVYRLLASSWSRYETRDRIRTSQPAAILFLQLISWVLLLWLSLSAMLIPFVASIGQAFREAEASLLTLGFTSTPNAGASAVDFLGGFTGLTVVALQISYLPVLYGAFNRREAEVAVLVARAGEPPWGPEMLARTRVGFLDTDLAQLYHAWERWAADVSETHSSYPVLLRFRSPDPYASWLVSLLAVMDAAALHLSLAPSDAPVEARLCLRMGFACLRSIAAAIGFPFDADPLPDNSINLTDADFAAAVEHLLEVGFPVEIDTNTAWRDFKGWRVNYESVGQRLAKEIDAVPALWSRAPEDRVTVIPTRWVRNRTYEDPEGTRSPLGRPSPLPKGRSDGDRGPEMEL